MVNFPFYDIKDLWPDIQLDIDITGPIISDVRTLFLSGELDLNTPPFQAEEVKWGFNNATHLIIKNAGHEQIISNDNIKKSIIRFLDGKDVGDVAAYHKKLRFVPLTGKDGQASHPSVTSN